MATVRISNTLRYEIVKLASASQEKAEIRAKESRPSNDWAEKIYNTLLGDEIALTDKVPEHWFTMESEFILQSVGGLDCGRMRFTFATPKRWPRNLKNELGQVSYVGSNELILTHNLLWGELHAEVLAWCNRVIEARDKRQDFVQSVRKILSSYSTLAPALKAWPPLWDFVPNDAKEKHKEITNKEKKAEVKLDVDLSKLTSMAVAAKIG